MYSCEGEYLAAMSAQAEAEAEMEQYRQYQEYLDNLIEAKQFELFSIEYCLDLLMSRDFKKSGLTPQQYLSKKKEQLQLPKEPVKSESQTLDF